MYKTRPCRFLTTVYIMRSFLLRFESAFYGRRTPMAHTLECQLLVLMRFIMTTVVPLFVNGQRRRRASGYRCRNCSGGPLSCSRCTGLAYPHAVTSRQGCGAGLPTMSVAGLASMGRGTWWCRVAAVGRTSVARGHSGTRQAVMPGWRPHGTMVRAGMTSWRRACKP